jgi:predicted N-formylglutamate amidohydrolase
MKFQTLISCEHAGQKIPEAYDYVFNGLHEILNSHRGWDLGAFSIAEYLSENLNCALYSCHTSRLLIEMNRSLNSPQLFSEFSQMIPEEEKDELIKTLYTPYREAVLDEIKNCDHPVLHLSIHSFTPMWNDEERQVDIGILFDPERKSENEFCKNFILSLKEILPMYQIKANEPYKGTDDGFTTFLRTQFLQENYLGIEIEVNQKFVGKPENGIIQHSILKSLLSLI